MPRSSKPPGEERLHVRIARSGLCSRRAAEALIAEGRVEVNGAPVSEMGCKVGPEDVVAVDGRVVAEARSFTLVFNKPVGCVTTLRDPQGRPTIARYLPAVGVQLKPVGRLDMETEGLLVVTNDGELANRLAHPRYEVDKEYQATVRGVATEAALAKLRTGVYIEGGKTKPAKVTLVHAEPARGSAVLRLIIHEGRKRQVRLMCEAVGLPVVALKRTRVGPLSVRGLRAGECRLLGKAEVDGLRRLVGLETDPRPAPEKAPARAPRAAEAAAPALRRRRPAKSRISRAAPKRRPKGRD